MNTVIEKLQGRRNKLIEQLNNLEEFRRGTVSVIYRKCGKPQCWCAKEGTRGHGPQYLWNATINRKSVAKNLIMGPESDDSIDWNNVFGSNTLLLSLLNTIFDGDDTYLKDLHKIFIDKWNKTV